MVSLVAIGLALSLDNFIIAMAIGAQNNDRSLRSFLRIPVIFAACAFTASSAGWLVGSQVAGVFSTYASVVACGILLYVGWGMLRSAWRSVNDGAFDASSFAATVALSLATSVDSLIVGFALALTRANVVELAVANGAACLLLSCLGILVGKPLGARFPAQSKIVAGLVLMGMGLRVVLAGRPW